MKLSIFRRKQKSCRTLYRSVDKKHWSQRSFPLHLLEDKEDKDACWPKNLILLNFPKRLIMQPPPLNTDIWKNIHPWVMAKIESFSRTSHPILVWSEPMLKIFFSLYRKTQKKCCKFLNSFVYLPDSNLHLEPQQKDFYSKFWYFLNLKSFVFFCKQSFAFVCLVFIISA